MWLLQGRPHVYSVFVFVLLSSSTLSVPREEGRDQAQGQGAQMQRHVVSCLLRADVAKSCNPDGGNDLSAHFMDLMEASPEEFKSAVEKVDLSTVSEARMADVAVPILYLIPADRLEKCAAETLANVMKRHGSNRAVARKLLSALDLSDDEKRVQFILSLGLGDKKVSLPVQAVIAEAAVRWWGDALKVRQEGAPDFAEELSRAGSPILAQLPPGFLAELPDERVPDMLLKLGNHPWERPDDTHWSEQPAVTKRSWMALFKRDRTRGRGQLMDQAAEGFAMLWAGATPDEILHLQAPEKTRSALQRLTLDNLQVRAMVETLYKGRMLTSSELNEVFDWVLQMSPAILQRFSVDTDFSLVPSADLSRASLPALKQVVEFLVASQMAMGNLGVGSSPGTWGRELKSLGPLVHVLPASQLQNYSVAHLTPDALSAVDSYLLSEKQARFLSANGSLVNFKMPLDRLRNLHGLVRAVPTKRLLDLRASLNAQGVLLHLVEALPPTHAARSAALFYKVRGTILEVTVFEAVLRNPAPGQYFRLMAAKKLDSLRADLEHTLAVKMMAKSMRAGHYVIGDFLTVGLNKKESIENRLLLLPFNSMSAILGSVRRELSRNLTHGRRPWTAGSLLNASRPMVSSVLAGLTCADVLATELTDLPAILHAYNQRRAQVGMPFPKRLHNCVQRAFEDYLEMKARVMDANLNKGLLSTLEPSEIEAFGGYVLTALQPKQVRSYKNALDLLKTIGSLSATELLAAMPDYKRLQEFALTVVDKLHARNYLRANALFHLGSLAAYLPPDRVVVIDPDSVKLFIEAHASVPTSLALCANAEQRDVWYRLLVRAFGDPQSWSSGVIASLADLIVALPTDAIRSIPLERWSGAADTLAQRTVFHRLVEVPGNDLTKPFVEACQEILDENEREPYMTSVRRLARVYLRASQDLLDTVEKSVQLVRRISTQPNRNSQRTRLSGSASAYLTTTTTSTTTESTTSTTSTTEPSLTTDPFGDDFWDREQEWVKNAAKTSTVIVREDQVARTVDTSTPSPSVNASIGMAQNASTGSEQLQEFNETAEKLNIRLNGSTQVTMPTTTSVNNVQANVSNLPVLEYPKPEVKAYPDVATGDKSGVNLSNATIEHSKTRSESVMDTPKNVTSATENDKQPVLGAAQSRRKRAYDPHDDPSHKSELEEELSSDVPLAVTCDALRTLGEASWLALVASDADRMSDEELEDCLEILGKLPLEPRIARSFWKRIMNQGRDVSFILGDMGHLVDGMSDDDVAHLDLRADSDRALDTLSVIAEHVTDPVVLKAAAERFTELNPSVVSRSMTTPDSAEAINSLLVALGPMVCYLPVDQLRVLLSRSGGLLHATHSLNMNAHRLSCNEPCLKEMASKALTPWPFALGPVRLWTPEDVRDLGVIVAGLSEEQLEDLKRAYSDVEKPVSGLTASAVRCMSPEQLKVIGDELAALSTQAAAAVSDDQMRALNEWQKATVLRVRNLAFTRLLGPRDMQGDDFDYSSAQNTVPCHGLLLIVLVPPISRWIL